MAIITKFYSGLIRIRGSTINPASCSFKIGPMMVFQKLFAIMALSVTAAQV